MKIIDPVEEAERRWPGKGWIRYERCEFSGSRYRVGMIEPALIDDQVRNAFVILGWGENWDEAFRRAQEREAIGRAA